MTTTATHYCFTICMTSAGNKGFEFQPDHLSHNLQYLKKSPRPALGGGLSFACRRLIYSGCRASNTAILLQLIQQLAGFADSQVFGDIAVKPLVNEFLRIYPVATRQAVDRLELVGRDRATTLQLRPTISLPPRELFLDGCGGLNRPQALLLPQLGVYRLPAGQERPVDLVVKTVDVTLDQGWVDFKLDVARRAQRAEIPTSTPKLMKISCGRLNHGKMHKIRPLDLKVC